MLDDILSGIYKPGRYIGNEWNVSGKDLSAAAIKFALCFPDLYEVGMSNLGVRILYGILNNIPDVACERVFSPAKDLEDKLRTSNEKIFTLESGAALKDFDILGFSLSSELGYTNILAILELSNIPFHSHQRNSEYPLIIGGGCCTLNPEPLHSFFDLFIIGEAEEAIVELVDVYRKLQKDFKSNKINKSEVLARLSGIEGVYVPSAPQKKIKKRIVKDLDSAFFPVKWLLPYIQIIHDRISMELMRGCPNKCRFCQARQQYYPCRIRSPQNIIDTAIKAYENSGYEEIALTGLSVSDYPRLEEVSKTLMEKFKDNCVSLSLPSIKPKKDLGALTGLLASFKKTGLTFAPEAASEKMRAMLGKDFNMEEFLQALEEAFAAGYLRVKLYFMIGLPFEETSDLDGIIELASKVSALGKKAGKRPAQVNISINTLIPKPHTAFQWFGMPGLEETKAKQDYLRDKAGRNRHLKLSFHNRQMSFLEAVFSRGNRNLSPVIEAAYKAGARFDAWDEHLNFELWLAAFKACGIDPQSYLQKKPLEEALPWDFLETGVSKQLLADEFNKMVAIE